MTPEQWHEHVNALLVFASAFGVAAFAGLATLLRFAQRLTKLTITSAMANSGFLGLSIALLWYESYCKEENVYGLIGFCVLAGMGGSSVTDLVFSLLAGAGIKVIIVRDEEEKEDKDKKGKKGAAQ
jgi:hypothetical protein